MRLAFRSAMVAPRAGKLGAAALLACMVFGAGPVAADERATNITRLMATAPLTCADAAGAWTAKVLVAGAVDKLTDNLREQIGLNDKWVRGNPDWEKARALIAAEFAAVEKRDGPALRPISGAAVAREGLESMSADELALAAKFLPTHAGKVYWTYTVDYHNCRIFADIAAKQPNAGAMDPALRARINQLDTGMTKELPNLSDADKAAFKAASAKFDGRFIARDTKYWNQVRQPLGPRAVAVMSSEGMVSALVQLAMPYLKKPV